MRTSAILVCMLIGSFSATAAADFTNPSLTLAQAIARLTALRLVLSLPTTAALYRRYHAEFDFHANDDMSHRIGIGEKSYCPDQVYVQATYEPSPDENVHDIMYGWIVNVRSGKVVGPKSMLMPEGLAHADLTGGGKCIDGSLPRPLPD